MGLAVFFITPQTWSWCEPLLITGTTLLEHDSFPWIGGCDLQHLLLFVSGSYASPYFKDHPSQRVVSNPYLEGEWLLNVINHWN